MERNDGAEWSQFKDASNVTFEVLTGTRHVQQLTIAELREVDRVLTEQLMKCGFDDEWHVTAAGGVLEVVIDRVLKELSRREETE